MLTEGSTTWWTSGLKFYNAQAQDPLSAVTTSPDMIAEHFYNSLVEAEYLRDTHQAAGGEYENLVDLLFMGKDLSMMRELVN